MKEKEPNAPWLSDDEKQLFDKATVQYSRSKADVWAALQAQTEGTAPAAAAEKEAKVIALHPARSRRLPLSIAASVALLACVALVLRFYTRTIAVEYGELATHTLPDGSVVQLNTESELSYQPYWWWARRQVQLQGEAFFEVEKGSAFTAISPQGTTQVLGTSFNIEARGQAYAVLCTTGRVRVTNGAEAEVILTPGLYTERTAEGLSAPVAMEAEGAVLGWRISRFVYNTTPLSKVLSDLERHYHITIQTEGLAVEDIYHTGSIPRNLTLDEALGVLSTTYYLTVREEGEGNYTLKAIKN